MLLDLSRDVRTQVDSTSMIIPQPNTRVATLQIEIIEKIGVHGLYN